MHELQIFLGFCLSWIANQRHCRLCDVTICNFPFSAIRESVLHLVLERESIPLAAGPFVEVADLLEFTLHKLLDFVIRREVLEGHLTLRIRVLTYLSQEGLVFFSSYHAEH